MSFEESFRALIRETVREVLADRPPAQGLEDFITYEQAGKEVGLCRRTIGYWVSGGKVPSYGEGRLKRVKRSEVRAYFESTKRVVAPASTRAVQIVQGLAPRGAKVGSR